MLQFLHQVEKLPQVEMPDAAESTDENGSQLHSLGREFANISNPRQTQPPNYLV
jgi:hypothetical protein